MERVPMWGEDRTEEQIEEELAGLKILAQSERDFEEQLGRKLKNTTRYEDFTDTNVLIKQVCLITQPDVPLALGLGIWNSGALIYDSHEPDRVRLLVFIENAPPLDDEPEPSMEYEYDVHTRLWKIAWIDPARIGTTEGDSNE